MTTLQFLLAGFIWFVMILSGFGLFNWLQVLDYYFGLGYISPSSGLKYYKTENIFTHIARVYGWLSVWFYSAPLIFIAGMLCSVAVIK